MANYYTVPTVQIPSTESITIIGDVSKFLDHEREAALAAVLSCFQVPHLSQLTTVQLVLTAFKIGIPSFGSYIAGLNSLSVNEVNTTGSDFMTFLNDSSKATTRVKDVFAGAKFNADALAITDKDGLYAALASILMATGRQPGKGPEAAGVGARPAALVSRFAIPQSGQGLLPGNEYGPTRDGLEAIYSAFSTYTEPRMFLVQFFLGIQANTGHPPKHIEILMTNFRLMRGSGMTHVDAIIKLMAMHPWTVRMPELSPYYSKFADELTEFAKVPLSVRSYHRLLVPQSDFKFISADYRPLIAVAGHYIKEVEKSFKDYVYNQSEYQTLIDKVRLYEPAVAPYVGASKLADRLGIQDVELPAPRQKTSKEANMTV